MNTSMCFCTMPDFLQLIAQTQIDHDRPWRTNKCRISWQTLSNFPTLQLENRTTGPTNQQRWDLNTFPCKLWGEWSPIYNFQCCELGGCSSNHYSFQPIKWGYCECYLWLSSNFKLLYITENMETICLIAWWAMVEVEVHNESGWWEWGHTMAAAAILFKCI